MQAPAFLVEECAKQRGRFFLWSPVFMAFGVALYFSLRREPAFWVAFLPLVLFLFLAFLMRRRAGARMLMFALALAGSGFALASVRTYIVHTPVLERKMDRAGLEGRVALIEALEGGAFRVVLDQVRIEGLEAEKTPRKVRIRFRSGDVLEAGQGVRVRAGLNPPSGPAYPGGFDFRRYAYYQGIGAVGFSYGKAQIMENRGGEAVGIFQRVQGAIGSRIAGVLPSRQAAVAAALITGGRAAISDEDNAAIQGAGLSHMLSISGLHVTMVFGAVFFAVRFLLACFPALALRWPIKKVAATAAIGAAIFYILISGMAVPALRSIFMAGVVFAAIMLDRVAISMRTLAFAALVVLAFWPESLMGVSFQLSFAAVAVLVAMYEEAPVFWARLRGEGGVLRRGLVYVLGVCLTSGAVTLATAPLTLFHFQQVPLYGVLGNVLAVPVLGVVVMPLAIVALLLMPFGFEAFPLEIAGWGIDAILRISHYVASLDGAIFRVGQWPAGALPFFGAAFVIAFLVRGWFRAVALLPFIAAVILVCSARMPDVIVSESGKLASVRMEGGALIFSTLRAEKFARENISKAYGFSSADKPERWPKEGVLGDLRCDPKACRIERGGRRISFLKARDVAAEECGWADVVVASFPLEACRAAHAYDSRALRASGSIAIWLVGGAGEAGLSIREARRDGVCRPWGVCRVQ